VGKIILKTFIRLALGTVAFLTLFLSLFLTLTDKVNYLVTDPAKPSYGWSVNYAQVEEGRFRAPDGSNTAIKVTSEGSDGHLVLYGLDVPYGSLTYSVYIRSDSDLTLKVILYPGKIEETTARITKDWQRFVVTSKKVSKEEVMVLVGGGGSFTKGETIYVAWPQLNSGDIAGPHVAIRPYALSTLEEKIEFFSLRHYQSELLWIFAISLLSIIFSYSQIFMKSRLLHFLFAFNENRWHMRTILNYCTITFVTLLLIEAIAFVTLVFLQKPKGLELTLTAASQVWRQAEIWPKRQNIDRAMLDTSTTFSPLTQIRRKPGDDLARPYRINKLGLVDNEGSSDELDYMPEKPVGLIRIILYGGSTAMGIGAQDGTETITAQLERMLNESAKPGVVFQVLNFGHGGNMTYSDLLFMTSMGTYLDPDISISLNGFNDAFFATESAHLYNTNPYLINWSDYSHHYYNSINEPSQRMQAALPLLTFSSALFNKVIFPPATGNALYENMPARLITEHLDKSNPLRDRLLLENLRFTASYFINRDSIFLSYLQPHPMQFRNIRLESSEKPLIEQSINRLSRLHYEDYRLKMIAQFDGYGKRYNQLSQEYANSTNIRFFDIRNLFEDFSEPAYIDIIHYSPASQKFLAKRILGDLKKFSIIKKNIID
jgi:hypothetical protein